MSSPDSESFSDDDSIVNIYSGVPDVDHFEKKICDAPMDFKQQDNEDEQVHSLQIELTSTMSSSNSIHINGASDSTRNSVPSIPNDSNFHVCVQENDQDDEDTHYYISPGKRIFQNQVFISFALTLTLIAVFAFTNGAFCMNFWQDWKDHDKNYQPVACSILTTDVDLGNLLSCSCGQGCGSTYPCLSVTASYIDPVSTVPSVALLTRRFANNAACYINMTFTCQADPAANVQNVQSVEASLTVAQPRPCYLKRAVPHLVAEGDDVPTLLKPSLCTFGSLFPVVAVLIWFVISVSLYCKRFKNELEQERIACLKSGTRITRC